MKPYVNAKSKKIQDDLIDYKTPEERVSLGIHKRYSLYALQIPDEGYSFTPKLNENSISIVNQKGRNTISFRKSSPHFRKTNKSTSSEEIINEIMNISDLVPHKKRSRSVFYSRKKQSRLADYNQLQPVLTRNQDLSTPLQKKKKKRRKRKSRNRSIIVVSKN